jgi:hypothetical protein
VLERHGAIPSDHPLVRKLLQLLHQARQQLLDPAAVQALLAPLRPRIAAAEQQHCGKARQLSLRQCDLPDPTAA